MGLYDDASLVFLPSAGAGKDTKAYSVKPTDGTGDFTFSRGSNLSATRVGPDGLIEKGRENKFKQSNNFTTTWTTVNLTLSSGEAGYDGTNNAWKFLPSGTPLTHFLYQNVTGGGIVTFSVYAKAAGYPGLFVYSDQSFAGKYFNVQNGTLGEDYGSPIDSSITSVGNGWYRCTVTVPHTSGNFNIFVSPDGVYTYGMNADGVSAVLVQDAQMESGLVATDYIESGATTGKAGILENEPRFDYSGGATCPSLLLEPSRTNLVTQSEYFGAWSNDTNTSLTVNAIQSPTGFVDAYKMSAGTSNARQARALNISTSGNLAFSTYAKKGEYSVVQLTDAVDANLYANFDLESGVLGNYNNCIPSIEDAGNGWYRCIITWTALQNINKVRISIAESKTQGRLVNFAGNGTDGIYIYGAQLEEASYPTSYIPNHSGGSVTRSADFPTTTISTDITDSTQGSVYFEFQSISATSTDVQNYFTLNTGTTDNIRFGVQSTGGIFRAKKDAVDLFSQGFPISDPTAVNKLAFRWGLNDWKLYLNGSAVYTSTSMATFESGDFTKLENGINNALGFLGNVRQLLVFPTKLTDNELQTLTT